MNTTPQHTPLPWTKPEYDNHGNGSFQEWWRIEGVGDIDSKEDAEFIVKACNMHYQLVEALQQTREMLQNMTSSQYERGEDKTIRDLIDRALAKATGGQL